MQLSARILTALAVVALAVAVVAGRDAATTEVSAATGVIDALNVGACTTTNLDVLDISDCSWVEKDENDEDVTVNNLQAHFQQGEIDAAIELDTLYATYAHDPKTGAEGPRAILQNTDLIKISVTDKGRDSRDGVLVFRQDRTNDTDTDDVDESVALDNDEQGVVRAALGLEDDDPLPTVEANVDFLPTDDFTRSGNYQIRLAEISNAPNNPYRPIAPDGRIRFFGTVTAGGTESAFQNLEDFISLDEDVVPGEANVPPALSVNVSVSGTVKVEVIYYETSEVEYILGGDNCEADNRPGDAAGCIDDEELITLNAESDEDAAETMRNLYLKETGRFTGVFQGYLRLTDADGDGSTLTDSTDDQGNPVTDRSARDNWGLIRGDATDETSANSAILGVGNGPVVINYKDTDDKNRAFEIQIDIDPPTIQIDSPVNKSRSDDEKPSFIGSFNDGDAGLVADSFELYVDNDDDMSDDDAVLLLESLVDEPSTKLERRLQYTGYDTNPLFGVISASEVYLPVDDDETYKSLESDDVDNGDSAGEFSGEVEIDFDENITDDDFEGFNHAIDFQAVVRDLAGNLGFSDSDESNPRFIDDFGEEKEDRAKNLNVLGVYSRHVVYVDEIDPSIHQDRTVTGFYGLDDGDVPVRNRSAIMVVFDNDVNGDLIDVGTFSVEDGDDAHSIVDVMVDDQLVFLMLDQELDSDATPTLSITEGREIEDLAGNILGWQETNAEAFEVKDGILPVFTLHLSGGSGTGSGSEGPSSLTNNAIEVAIESDEDINGAPRVAFVCSNLSFKGPETADGSPRPTGDLDDFVANRTGGQQKHTSSDAESDYACGSTTRTGDFSDRSSLSRPGNNWVYAWRNSSDDLPDGDVTVVVHGRDRNSYVYYKTNESDSEETHFNHGSATVEFSLDTAFHSPLKEDGEGGSVQPTPGEDVAEPRPFVLLDFAGENTTVSVTEMTVDGDDVLDSLESIGDNRFLYWPEELAYGTHVVEFDARDAADNEPDGDTKFEFEVSARDPFVIDLTAGWNAISFPADPITTALDQVFTEESVDRVVGWDPSSETGPWSIASRIDGVWTTSESFAPLTDVHARYGYWVHSASFVEQSVQLVGPVNRETGAAPAARDVPTVAGWNFVGVVDQDGDQTEGNFGEALANSEGTEVTANAYMPGFRRAYTWDAIANGYRILNDTDTMTIGHGIWVYFPRGTNVAP